MTFFAISHKTRGWYTGSEYEPVKKGGYDWVPHFAWSVGFCADRVHKMFSDSEVQRELDKMPKKIREGCTKEKFEL